MKSTNGHFGIWFLQFGILESLLLPKNESMRFAIATLVVLFLFSCEKKAEIEINSVEITPVFIDSLSIRAIQPLNDKQSMVCGRQRKGRFD